MGTANIENHETLITRKTKSNMTTTQNPNTNTTPTTTTPTMDTTIETICPAVQTSIPNSTPDPDPAEEDRLLTPALSSVEEEREKRRGNLPQIDHHPSSTI